MKEGGGIQASPDARYWIADGGTPERRNERYIWTWL
jgi:hypothetical protein